MNERPKLSKIISINDFKDFYWLKEELVDFCRRENLVTTGGKIEITRRIEEFLLSGKRIGSFKKQKAKSTFDWTKEVLSLNTIITDSYKNSVNVRAFFIENIGEHFKFNVRFMNWMKISCGKTLKDAIEQWILIDSDRKTNKSPKVIAPQFEYNTYIRDFLKDNHTTREMAIKYWNVKKKLRGDNIYKRSDLDFNI